MTMDEWTAQKESQADIEHLKPEDVVVEEPGKAGTSQRTGMADEVRTTDMPSESKAAGLSLVLGIVSIVLGILFAGAPWLGILAGIAAIVIASVELKNNNPNTKGKAAGGLVCGIVGIVFSIVIGIICFVLGTAFKILFGLFSCLG
ncbi:MAG: DUF4190 domain-containing protein [Lachnospiraceae bacterium]|nr:DUF4190 domain-containing protein [Lachnospiraceae bacterium]